ncbi:hypothetical protein BDR03DRAFT_964618 [Suillus americanus]|nr:hypothetical protein BDR03DRAFT_964618 [Suillus americanus]
MSRMSLTLYLLTIHISFFISLDAHKLARSSLCVIIHAPAFTSHSRSSHETRRSHTLFFCFLISLISVSASPWDSFSQMEEILPSTNGRFLADSRPPDWLFASQARRQA